MEQNIFVSCCHEKLLMRDGMTGFFSSGLFLDFLRLIVI